LLVSGGGDPFTELPSLYQIVEEVDSDTIVLITSVFWARAPTTLKRTMDGLLEAIKKRKKKSKIVLRLSLDKGHFDKLTFQPFINLIKDFQERRIDPSILELQIHTMFNDSTVDKLLENFSVIKKETEVVDNVQQIIEAKASSEEKDQPIKVSSRKLKVTLENNFSFTIGYAKYFYADPKVDLNNKEAVERGVAVFDKDMRDNQKGNPSVVFSPGGKKGLDFVISYDGWAFIWAADSPDRKYSIYTEDYQDIVSKTFSDITSLAVIEKGLAYRENIINEVNPKAVIRTKAINIRDFIGSYINEEAKTRFDVGRLLRV